MQTFIDGEFNLAMDPWLTELMEQAESIGASGRWDSVNETVKHWAVRSKTRDEVWYGELFSSLCFRVFSEYGALKKAFAVPATEADLALLAWRARNLLELSVWATFCARDRQNARRFFEDLGRDANNLLGAFETWAATTGQSAEWIERSAGARDGLRQGALKRGVQSIDGKFTSVAEAAKEIGLATQFSVMNKLLSKFAHPTAMLTLANSESIEPLKESVFANGCLFLSVHSRLLKKWQRLECNRQRAS